MNKQEQTLCDILTGTLVIGNGKGIPFCVNKILAWHEKEVGLRDEQIKNLLQNLVDEQKEVEKLKSVDYKEEYDQACREIRELNSQIESLEGDLRDSNDNAY